MKHIFYLILASAMALIFVQCKDDHVEFLQLNSQGSRSIAPEDISETNPTLLTDWENCKTVKLNEVAPNGENYEATLPWQDGSSTYLNETFRKDIKAADGWSMLFHTFCKSNTDVGLSYMCFYNKFTGYLKVFYYASTSDLGTNTIWHVSSSDYKTPQPLFADMEYFSQPIEGDNTRSVWSVTAENMTTIEQTGVSVGWNGFEFRVGEYHPTITTNDLCITAYNTAYTNIKFDGVTESTIKGTITTTNASASSGGKVLGAVANAGGSGAKKLVDSIATKHLDKSFLGINFKNIITSVATQNYISAFKSGLGLIFKGVFKKEPTVQEVKLQSNGTITLKGTAGTNLVSKSHSLSFNLENVLSNDSRTFINSSNSAGTDSIGTQHFATANPTIKSLQKTELGVWNLRKKPTMYYDRYTKFDNLVEYTENDFAGTVFDFNGLVDYPTTHINSSDFEVVFNPAIKEYVKSYSVDVGMIDVEGGNRVLNTKGKNIIEYNFLNIIKTDSERNIHVYGINPLQGGCSGSLYNCPPGLINENSKFYIDWGENVGGNRAAVITLTMDIDYNGKQMTLTESRVYDVIYKPYSPSWMVAQADYPPYSVVVNKKEYGASGFLPSER